MTLRRTASALYSLHLFFKVDQVVYCEGGKPIDASQLMTGGGTSNTLDTLFWSSIIDLHCRDGKKRHFKSIGDKKILLSLLSDVERERVNSIRICLDRDHENYTGSIPSSAYLAVTKGYSWENDAMHISAIKHIIGMYIDAGESRDTVYESMYSCIDQLAKDLVKWTEIDIAVYVRRRASLFQKSKPLSNIEMPCKQPKIKEAMLNAKLKDLGYKSRPKRVVKLDEESALENTFGKLVAKALYHIFIDVINNYVHGIRIEYDTFMRLAINAIGGTIAAGELAHLKQHYQQFARNF